MDNNPFERNLDHNYSILQHSQNDSIRLPKMYFAILSFVFLNVSTQLGYMRVRIVYL